MEAFGDRKFQGKVWRISPTVDQSKRTFIVEALIDNPKGELKPGSYARASLPTNKSETVKLVPARAVAYVFGSNKAYVVTSAKTIEAREVKLGDRFDQHVEILEGVEDGEKVAVTQLARLDTGAKVAVSKETSEPQRLTEKSRLGLSAPPFHLDIEPLDLLIQRGKRNLQHFRGVRLAPVACFQASMIFRRSKSATISNSDASAGKRPPSSRRMRTPPA